MASPAGLRSRRESVNSVSASSQIDRDQLALTLDKIHTTASQSETLTTFHDFGPPPGTTPAPDTKGGAGELVQQGLTGLYSRFKEAVGAVSKPAAQDADEASLNDAASKKSSSTVHTSAKIPASSVSRGESLANVATLGSAISSDPQLTSMSGPPTGESTSQMPQSSKTSSLTNITVKSASSGGPSFPKIVRTATSTAADPTVASVTVGAFREPAKGVTHRAEESTSRHTSRRSISKPSDGPHPAKASASLALYDVDPTQAVLGDRIMPQKRSRREDSMSIDGSMETPLSPTKNGSYPSLAANSTDSRVADTSSRLSASDKLKTPAIIDRLSRTTKSAALHSTTSSAERGTAEPSPISTSAHNSVYHESFAHDQKPEQLRSGKLRIPGTTINEGAPGAVNARLEQMRKQVVSKEFWMADETCKECFLCGDAFSAFRRKHHCRACGCIFDSKCTVTISGQKVGVTGNLRVCKTCLAFINNRHDSASDDSADDSYLPQIFRSNTSKPTAVSSRARADDEISIVDRPGENQHSRSAATPMMAIPATRWKGDASNRNSAILEIAAPQLSRPSSSRSLRSLNSGRPQSSGHKRHASKHNLLSRFRTGAEESAPFRKSITEEMGRKSKLPAFHDDNIIDPDLAPYMSDESSDDEQMSIFATMASNDLTSSSFDHDRPGFGPFGGAGRKYRHRGGEKSISGLSFTTKGADDHIGLPGAIAHSRPGRRRNLSTTSTSQHHMRSPRPKSGIFKPPNLSTDALSIIESSSVNESKLTRHDSVTVTKDPARNLNEPVMEHVRKLFRQLLEDEEVSNVHTWEKALVPLFVQCADDVDPEPPTDQMDIRHYVKLKKIPGGKPSDSSYVSGVIFTKKLALKSMPRNIVNPRIVIVSFPLEYTRQQHHFMSLGPVIEQEREFLRMLVNRIINLRPQVLIAQKGISGLALQFLSEANIAVAYNVKPSVIAAIARCINCPIISSTDMLNLPNSVGICDAFEVKTYINNDFPGRKKTYITISGGVPDLGCTVAIRGASTEVLSRVKRVTEFMVYVVYNLKLESCLLRDQSIKELEGADLPGPSSPFATGENSQLQDSAESCKECQALADPLAEQGGNSEPPSRREESMSPVHDSTVDGPRPDPQTTERLISLHHSHTRGPNDTQVPEDVPPPTFYSDMVATYESRILSISPFVKFAQPYLLMKAREQERRLVYLKRLRDRDMVEEQSENEKAKPQKFQLLKPDMVHDIGRKAPRQMMEVLHAVHDAEYDKALYNYRTQTKAWETYLQGSIDLFNPFAHQNITVLYSMVCTKTSIPCAEPTLLTMCFYDEGVFDDAKLLSPDCTLGQYIEELCDEIDSTCEEHGCDQYMSEHHRTYVHDQARLTFFVQRNVHRPLAYDRNGRIVPDDQIVMWNYCKQCGEDIGAQPMSNSTWKYSFAKYLEISFWGKGLKMDNTSCTHDRQLDYLRYFNFRGISVRVHYDSIDLLELVVPRTRITWKVDHDLRLKNEIFLKHEEKWIKYITSIKTRIKGIRTNSILPEKAKACEAELARLLKMAQEVQPVIIKHLQNAYMSSKYYEVIPMNECVRMMLEQVAEWDAAFAQFEADFLSDKDVRQLTMIQLRKMFSDNDSTPSLTSTDSSGVATMATESEDKSTPPTSQNTAAEFDEKTSSPHGTDAEGSTVPSLTVSTEGLTATPEAQSKLEKQAEQMLERVEPLDLATPASPQAVRSSLTPKLTPESSSEEPASTAPSVASAPDTVPPPSSATPTVDGTETPKQAPAPSTVVAVQPTDELEHLSEIPSRVGQERTPSRRAGLTVSPPMLRALSQPAGILPRTMSAISKVTMSKDAKVAAAAVATDAAIGADLHRVNTEGPIKVEKKFADKIGLTAFKNRKSGQSSIPRFVHKTKQSKVSTLAKHFEQLSREFEKERIKDRRQRAAKLHNTRAFLPRTNTRATVQVYDNVKQAIEEVGPTDEDLPPKAQPEGPVHEPPSTTAEAAALPPSAPVSPIEDEPAPAAEPPSQIDEVMTEADTDVDQKQDESGQVSDEERDSEPEQDLEDILPDVETIAEHLEQGSEVPKDMQKDKKSTFMKMLTNFWAERSASGWAPLDFPVAATDHVLRDSNIVVREDEPSSLVAYALDTETYKTKLAASRQQLKMAARRAGSAETDETAPRSGVSDSASVMVNDVDEELNLIRAQATHIKLQFDDGPAKFQCKIYFAEAFDALRRKCGVSERVIESLSRCVKWDSKGGKTKSVFLKTLDDRLVMKSLSPIEMRAFVNFAPTYFSHMSDALFHDMPSAIAKMLGFFHVSIKNTVTGTETNLDLLLMENLFYDRTDARKFDLKGSMRNRKVQSTGEQNEVLLDENMVEFIYESPLFAREHSKKTLRQSVFNDTLFLARQDVMDYSLMVAVDEPRRELVVGIIDCIRTYTWDKELESWIKSRGFAGGGRNRPTVTSPKEYKSRFREAMNRYILQAPNPWHQFESPHPLAPVGMGLGMGMGGSGSQLIIPAPQPPESVRRLARFSEEEAGVDEGGDERAE